MKKYYFILILIFLNANPAFPIGGNDDLPIETRAANADDDLSEAAKGKQRASEEDSSAQALLPPPEDGLEGGLIDDDDTLAEAIRESRYSARKTEEDAAEAPTTGGGSAAGGSATEDQTSMALVVAPSLVVTIPPKDLSTPLTMQQAIMFRKFDGRAVALALDKIITNIAYEEALKAIETKGDRFAELFSRRITKITVQITEKLLLSVVNAAKMKTIIERMTGTSMSLADEITDAIHTGAAPATSQTYAQKAKEVLRAKWAADLFMKRVLGPQIIGPLVAQSFHKLKVGTTTYNVTIKALQERYAGDEVLAALDQQNKAKYNALFDQKKPLEEELKKIKEAAQTIIDQETKAKKQPESELATLQTTVDTTLADFKTTQGWGDTLALWKSNKKLAEQKLEQEVANEGDKPAGEEKKDIEKELTALQEAIDSTLQEFKRTQGYGDTFRFWTTNKALAEQRLKEKAAQEGGKPAGEEKKDIERELTALQEAIDRTLAAFKAKQTLTDTLKLGTTHKQLAEQKLQADDTDNDTKQKARSYLDALTDQETKKPRLETRLQELNEIINQQKAQAYFDAVEELENKKPGLEARLKELQDIINKQKTKLYLEAVEEQEKKKPALDAKVAKHQGIIDTEKAKIAKKEKELSDLERDIKKLEAEMEAYYQFTQDQEYKEKQRQTSELVEAIDDEAQLKALKELPLLDKLKYNGKTLEELMGPCPGLDPGILQRLGSQVVSVAPRGGKVAATIGQKYIKWTGMQTAVQEILEDAKDAYTDIRAESEKIIEVAKENKEELIAAAEREAKRAAIATAMYTAFQAGANIAKTAKEAHQQGKTAKNITIEAAKAGGKGAVSGAKKGVGAYCQMPLDPRTIQAIAPMMKDVGELRKKAVQHYGELIVQADELSRKTHRAFILPAQFVAQSAALYTTLGLVNYLVGLMATENPCSNMAILLITFGVNAFSTYMAYMDSFAAESYLPSMVPVPTAAGGESAGLTEESDDEDEDEEDKKER